MSPVCDAQFALCSEVLGNVEECLNYTDECFEDEQPQATCLSWFAACYLALNKDPAPAGPTCKSYGDVCLELREGEPDYESVCRQRFEACAAAGAGP